MRVTYKPVRVIHWDRPAGTGCAEFSSEIAIRLTFDCITVKDEMLFMLEERFRIFKLGTTVQVGSWIAEQKILVKFNEGPKTAMAKCLQIVKQAHQHFNTSYLATVASDGCVSGDMATPTDENIAKLAIAIASEAENEGILRAVKKPR